MPRIEGAFARFLARLSIDTVRLVLKVGRKRVQVLSDTLVVMDTANEPYVLEFSEMFMLNPEAIAEEKGAMIDSVALTWPSKVQQRSIRELRDGISLCDISAVLRDDVYGVAFIQYGLIAGKWKLRFDPNVKCSHAPEGTCPEHCTVTIHGFNAPRRRRKKQRETILSKFKLPDLMPQRGWAPA